MQAVEFLQISFIVARVFLRLHWAEKKSVSALSRLSLSLSFVAHSKVQSAHGQPCCRAHCSAAKMGTRHRVGKRSISYPSDAHYAAPATAPPDVRTPPLRCYMSTRRKVLQCRRARCTTARRPPLAACTHASRASAVRDAAVAQAGGARGRPQRRRSRSKRGRPATASRARARAAARAAATRRPPPKARSQRHGRPARRARASMPAAPRGPCRPNAFASREQHLRSRRCVMDGYA